MYRSLLITLQVEAGRRQSIDRTQHAYFLCLDIERRWFSVVSGWYDYLVPDVQECPEVDKTKDQMAAAG